MKRALIFDPFAGISGDMILGALVDLGMAPEWLERFVAQLGLGDIRIHIERTHRRGIACGRVRFDLPPQHEHRHLRHVVEIIEKCQAPAIVKQRAITAFTRLAEAEAAVHGTTVEKVHFHEVGALDAILDVLCAMAGVHKLGFDTACTRPVQIGRGWVDIEHGRFPVPAPATLRLLQQLPVRDDGIDGECTTPTGAAILATLTGGAEPPPVYRVHAVGFGAGSRDPASHPNALRVIAAGIESELDEPMVLIQSDVDDIAPEFVPAAQQALLDAGALDATVSSVLMKKGRPALRFEALAPESAREAVLAALFRSTPTIGARYWPVERPSLSRTEETVTFQGQALRVKRVVLPGGVERTKPEYEDIVRAARALGMEPAELRRKLEQNGTNEPRRV